MDDRQRLEELINELNMYKAQAELLNQQIETLKVSISELVMALETLDELKGKKGVETFVPIGAGSFLITEIKNTEEIIVGVGAGAAIKKGHGQRTGSLAF
ncbi:MAG TPA: prefoldin subunit alpha, partial [Methanobacteriaceae archaeon]|nr:prefoldin subunit alpha [Methanobacteriaceae archaeon]